jgi:hypothetical protein
MVVAEPEGLRIGKPGKHGNHGKSGSSQKVFSPHNVLSFVFY